ncbi:MAG TPA: Holliday junction branch migration protein RuvA, partial [Verrucomicrobiae bacterium]|nr:Holliday junction branch migration protein RuvA [Verrucomicrobiae bacterium]
MIAMLKGQMVLVREDYIVLDVNGVGYKVFVPAVPAGLPGQQLTLFTYLHVREDAMVLYGFVREEQLDMFELLISVSGMGPKGALGVLAHLDVDSIRRVVGTGDLGILTGIPGVGKKTAQRLILELKDKLKVEDGFAPELIIDAAVPMDEALEAL